MTRVITWFSCGAASAVASKIAIELYGDIVLPVYCNTMINEHSDNQRFFNEVESWLGKKITIITSTYASTVEQVWDKRQYMSGPQGAPCTVELKKKPRFDFQLPDDVHVFGFTVDEWKRAQRLQKTNPELMFAWPLMAKCYTKDDCKDILTKARIKLPIMYTLGYKNNNCIGCVKASSPKYWNKIRQDFPEIFDRRCEQSRRIGCRLVILKGKRIFLDELPKDIFTDRKEDLSCGPECRG